MADAKKITFVTGEKLVYHLSNQDKDEMMYSLKEGKHVEVIELADGVLWASDLDAVKREARFF